MRALVTGCGRRLGFYLCEQLVAAGWQVTGSYRSERPELATLAALGVELVQADFGREEDVGKLIDVLATHQDLALVIHNASAFEPQATDPAAQLAQFEQFYRVHMAAPFQLNRALAPCWPAIPTPASFISPISISMPRPPVLPAMWPPRREPIRWP